MRRVPLYLLLCLLGLGCVSYPLKGADDLSDEGRHGRAILRYRAYLSERPNGRYAEDAMFRIGKSYYAMSLTLGAQQELRNYLFLYPNGRYAAEARSILQEIAGHARAADEQSRLKQQEIRQEIEVLQQRLKKSEGRDLASLHFTLAGKYWELSEFAKAFEHDQKAYQLNPDYGHDLIFRGRVNFTANGEPYSKALAATSVNREIVQVRNTSTNVARIYPSSRRTDHVYREYVISGEVTNVGTAQVKNVKLEVTVYLFNNTILGSKMVNIGNLSPQQVRTFSTKFSDHELDDVYRISGYKVRPIYDAPSKPKK